MTEPTSYRKKPVVIQAMQWDGTAYGATPIINWVLDNHGTARFHSEQPYVGGVDSQPFQVARLFIDTLEGTMHATAGYWIIKGVNDEFYDCEPGIFAATYEAVEATP